MDATSWLFASNTGFVRFTTCTAQFQLTKERGLSCDTSINEKVIATLSWEVRPSRKVELRISETERVNTVSKAPFDYPYPDHLDGVSWLVEPDGKFNSIINIKEAVDRLAVYDMINRKLAEDAASAKELLYGKRIPDKPDFSTLKKMYEDMVEREVKTFWWDILQAYLPNEKGAQTQTISNFEFDGTKRVKSVKTLKFPKKGLMSKIDGWMKEYLTPAELSACDFRLKNATWEYTNDIIYGDQSSRPHICTSYSRMEVTTEAKIETFQDVSVVMSRKIFLWDATIMDMELANRETSRFASDCRFSYQKDWAVFSNNHVGVVPHEVYSFMQDVFVPCNVFKGSKMNANKIETVLEKMLGHANNEPQLVVMTIDSFEFAIHILKECYKTNYAFSHLNFLFMKVEPIYGHLMKLGGKLKNKWQERYFVFDRVLGLLVYWQRAPLRLFEPETGSIHVADLADCEKTDASPGRLATLNLIPKDKSKKVYQLGASSGSEVDRWMKEIKKAIQEFQDLKIAVDANISKAIFRVRNATLYTMTQHLQNITEISLEE